MDPETVLQPDEQTCLQGIQGHSPASHPLQLALAFQAFQVPPDRHIRYTQALAQVLNRNQTIAFQSF